MSMWYINVNYAFELHIMITIITCINSISFYSLFPLLYTMYYKYWYFVLNTYFFRSLVVILIFVKYSGLYHHFNWCSVNSFYSSPLYYFSPSLTLNNCNVQQISNNINSELNYIFVWLCVNKLALNVKKTKYMTFHNQQCDLRNLILNLNINNEPVERVNEFNFLGLTIDETLSWHLHVQKISNKISRI